MVRRPEFAVGYITVDFIVEYDAVLQNFHNRCTFVATGGHHALSRYFEVDIDGTGEEMPPCPESESAGMKGSSTVP